MPNDNVHELRNNDALWARLSLQTSLQLMKSENITRCQSCRKGAPVQARCLHEQCRHFLCATCMKAHEEMIIFRDHQLETVVQMRDFGASSSTTKCSKHPTQIVSLFCESCGNPGCRSCFSSEHSRLGHRVVKIADSLPRYRESLKEAIPTLKCIANKFRKAADSAEQYKRKAEQTASRAHIAKFMSQILLDSDDREFIKLYPQVRDAVKSLTNKKLEPLPGISTPNEDVECPATESRPSRRFTNLDKHVKSLNLDHVNGFGDRELDSEVFSQEGNKSSDDGSDKSSDLPDVIDEDGMNGLDDSGATYYDSETSGIVPKQEDIEDPMDDDDKDTSNTAGSMPYEESSNSSKKSERGDSPGIDELVSWYRVGKVGGKKSTRKFACAKGVAVAPSGSIAIADNRRNKVDILDQNLSFLYSLKKPGKGKGKGRGKGTFLDAEDVAFNSIGHILVVDQSKYVHEYSIEAKFLRKFSVLASKLPPSTKVYSSCIAIDKRDHVYVGDHYRKLISHHNGNSLVRTVEVMTSPMYLAVNDHQQLLVSAGDGSRVLMVEMSPSKSKNPDTTEVFSMRNGSGAKVTGVVWSTDSDSDAFFIATQQENRGNGQVHLCSDTSEQKHITTIVGYKLNNPLGLALSSSNVLVVADMFSVKCYHKDMPEFSQSF